MPVLTTKRFSSLQAYGTCCGPRGRGRRRRAAGTRSRRPRRRRVPLAAGAGHRQQVVVAARRPAGRPVRANCSSIQAVAAAADLAVIEVGLRRVDRDDRDAALAQHRVALAEELLEVDVADVARVVVAGDDDDRRRTRACRGTRLACSYSCLKPNVVRSPEQTTMSGSRSLISLIARSSRLGHEVGPPQWRSERCAIVNVVPSDGAAMRRSIRTVRLSAVRGRATLKVVSRQAARVPRLRGATPPRFANDAELECARILDYYGVPWEYEPRTFVLEQDANGRVTRRSRPTSTSPSRISTSR